MTRFLGLRGARLGSTISAVCGLCFLCFGYAQGVLGALLTMPAFLAEFPQIDTINNLSGHNARLQGITMGTWNLGCFASAILTIFIGDYLGRKKTLLLGLVIWIIGEIIQSSSYNFGQFIAGRFIAGFGNGFTTSTVPAYQAECVKSHRKGTILMISAGAFIAAGLAISYWVSFGFAYLVSNPSASWRVPIALQIAFAVVAFFVLLFMPESPRWLILTGREKEALAVLAALNDEDEDGPEIRDEFLQIKDAILIMSQGSTSSMRSNKDKRNLHRTVLAYCVQIFQQMSGINLVLQYLALMFYKQMGYTGWVARLLGGCAATEYFLASFIAVVGIDRFWGRRSLMMFGAGGMCLCMVLLTILTYLWQEHKVGGSNIAATVFLFGFATFFAIGWQGMAWLYQVEVVPLRIRGPANALSTSGNWLFNFIVVLIAPIAFHNIGYRTYIIFACTNFAIVPLIYFLYPETAYRSLEEVDVLFYLASKTPRPWLSVVKIAAQEPLWFGRKGDVPFDYEKSDWHRRYMQMFNSDSTLSNEKNKHASNRSPPDPYHMQSNGSFQQTVSGDSGSPVDREPSSRHSSKQLTSSQQNRQSTHSRSSRPRINKFRREGQNKSYQSAKSSHSAYSAVSAHSAHSDPSWQESEFAPAPLRVPSIQSTRDSLNSEGYRGGRPRASSDYDGLDEPVTIPMRTASGRAARDPGRMEDQPMEDHQQPTSRRLNPIRNQLLPRDAGRSGGYRT
ncbi:hypothetical protein BU24DRAFT_490061 [Aaosphaeria arxii CBS 175.79]|uniref:Major facilitator superfamily (MFS) profile domain-containing protein n=1 Tax=Aaosphaeria arxii CBS 175.79 TaxID=1450172 RepID=A0A6A5Y4U3_9PLEO|nr:uncharacterized protein BU24DRAFT_490061 [Aaosphaeria arxii CBS 175.79]KAF2020279.1 hypothetical protein BU24DRAFT_490061 [Aaosphaeria arxii CBS 175.79]